MEWKIILLNILIGIIGGLLTALIIWLVKKWINLHFKKWDILVSLIIGLIIGIVFQKAYSNLSDVNIMFSYPINNGKIECKKGSDSTYKVLIKGTSSGIVNSNYSLLLWLYPVSPRSEISGWYLQKNINGIKINNDGSWEGIAQIGNIQYPPQQGDIIDISVSVIEENIAAEMLYEKNVTIRSKPIGKKYIMIKNIEVSLD